MNLTHRFSVPASLDAAWAAFSRLDQIAPCFPGATVTHVNGRDYAGFVKIKFGPIPLVYNGSAQVTELNRRLKAIGAQQGPLPLPKGPMPKSARQAKGMRGM